MDTQIAETCRHAIRGIDESLDREDAYQRDYANARLIAAAPDLLDAVQRACLEMKSFHDQKSRFIIKQCEDAIKKALFDL